MRRSGRPNLLVRCGHRLRHSARPAPGSRLTRPRCRCQPCDRVNRENVFVEKPFAGQRDMSSADVGLVFSFGGGGYGISVGRTDIPSLFQYQQCVWRTGIRKVTTPWQRFFLPRVSMHYILFTSCRQDLGEMYVDLELANITMTQPNPTHTHTHTHTSIDTLLRRPIRSAAKARVEALCPVCEEATGHLDSGHAAFVAKAPRVPLLDHLRLMVAMKVHALES